MFSLINGLRVQDLGFKVQGLGFRVHVPNNWVPSKDYRRVCWICRNTWGLVCMYPIKGTWEFGTRICSTAFGDV